MPREEIIRIGFKISKDERDRLEVLLRLIRLLYPEEMNGNEWRRSAFWYLMDNYTTWMPSSVIELAKEEPAELGRRMAELEKQKGRVLSPTGQLQAIRRWRVDLSKQAKDLMEKARLVDAIEAQPVEPKPTEVVHADIAEAVIDIIKKYDPEAQAICTCDINILQAQILSLWKSKGYLMRINDGNGAMCWTWIADDYQITFPEYLTVTDIESFGELTPEESDGYE